MIEESRKILHDSNLRVTATTARVPVLNSHSESINIELNKTFDLDDVVNTFKEAKSLVVMDDPSKNLYPTPLNCDGKDEVFVGRIKKRL